MDAQGKVVYDLTPRHQLSMAALFGSAVFDEGDPDIGNNEIRKGISRAWLTSLSWRYLPSPRVRRHAARLFNRPALQQRQPRRRRRSTPHGSPSSGGAPTRSFAPSAASGRGIRRRCSAPERRERDRRGDDRAIGQITLNRLRPARSAGLGVRTGADRHRARDSRSRLARVSTIGRLTRFDDCVPVGERGVASVGPDAPARRQRRLSPVSRSRSGATALHGGGRDLQPERARARRCRHRAHAAAPDPPALQRLRAARRGRAVGAGL